MKKILFLTVICGFIGGFESVAAEKQQFICLKCQTKVQKTSRPNVSYCDASGNHNWHSLGKVGKQVFFCRKCKLKVNMQNRPNVSYCTSGGNHNWHQY